MGWKRKLGLFTVFTGTVIGTMHMVNRIFSYIATADDLLEESSYQFYEWRFGRIAYKIHGQGSPLLLIHDLNVCSSSREWKDLEDKLAETHTVYTLDLLGCGCSDHPVLTYTNYLYVQLITDFIKHIIKEKTDVIVSCGSCSFVLMACANDDTIIDRIAMINPDNLVNLAKIPTKRTKLIKYLLYTPVLGTFIYNMKVNKKTITQHCNDDLFYDTNTLDEREILTGFEASHKDKTRSKYLYACQKSRYLNMNLMCCLNKINNSIFVITGGANPENLLTAEQYQNQIPSIEIIEMENTKKFPHVEKPDEFTEQIQILFSEEK